MSQRILATFTVEHEGQVETETRVMGFFDDTTRLPVGAAQIETSFKFGTVASWTWLGAESTTHAMTSAIMSVGWGSLLVATNAEPASHYKKVDIL
jgi:hypothetical protein